jgi:DNA modification methylase
LNRGQGNNKINDLKLLIMIEGINKVHHINFLDNDLPDKCANLIIADPPYFEVKGDFDFIWNSFEDYLKDVEKWAIECKRILADNGTLFWYGSSKRIAYAQVIFDKYFNLINNLVWDKGAFMGLEESDGLRSFAPCTERILMYSNFVEANKNIYKPIINYIKTERLKCGWSYTQMDNFLNIKASSCYWDKETSHEYVIPTKENWIKLQETGYFQKPYEELRKEYEELRRPFNNMFKLQEILRFSNEAVKTGAKYDHDTVKPETLTRALILTCSRPNDLVVVPFAGSGTECAMAAKENRNFWACDIEKKYVKMSNDRCIEHLQTQSLF